MADKISGVRQMKLDLMDALTLDDDEVYIVANISHYQGKQYYLLCNDDDIADIMLAYVDGAELVSVEDEDEFIKILQTFDTKKAISDLIH